MAKTILTVLLIVLLNVLVGCHGVDSGRSQLMLSRTRTSLVSAPVVKVSEAGESDIIEQMSIDRQAYRQGLGFLVQRYTKMGNDMKLMWAKRELAALDDVPQFNYIIEASVAGPNLKASGKYSLNPNQYSNVFLRKDPANRKTCSELLQG